MSDESYLGSISGWAPNFAPRGWMMCQGQVLSISQNTALFSILGVVYGGNGVTDFAIPDLSGRVPVGATQSSSMPYSLGVKAGQESVTLTSAQMPSHTHEASISASASLPASSATATASTPDASSVLASAAGTYGRDGVDVKIYAPAPGTVAIPLQTSATVTVSTAGASQPVSIMQPYSVINYIICQQGIYPPRP